MVRHKSYAEDSTKISDSRVERKYPIQLVNQAISAMNSKESQQINAFVHEVCQHHNAVMAAVFQKAFGCQTLDESIRSESEKRGMARGMIRGRLIGATNYKIRMIRKMLEDDLSPYSIAKSLTSPKK